MRTMIAPLAALPHLAGFALLTLILTGCGAQAAAQTYFQDHLQCTTLGYGNPQWSPDGALIYYNQYRGSLVDLHVMNAYGKNDRLLASNAGGALLSPDGSMVLFQRAERNTTLAYGYYVLDLKTMKTRRLNQPGAHASWSPDSQWVMYSTPVANISALIKASPLTSETAQLPDVSPFDDVPLWSPDGGSVAFLSTRDGSSGAVFLMHPDGSGITRLTAQPLTCPQAGALTGVRPVAWLPDGKSLAVMLSCDSNSTLHVITTAGVESVDLSSLGQDIDDAVWSPDGKQVAYTGTNGKVSTLSAANSDGSGMQLLQAGGTTPRWSPDGKQIAFAGMDQAGLQEIFTVKPDGSGLTQLTENPGAGRICPH